MNSTLIDRVTRYLSIAVVFTIIGYVFILINTVTDGTYIQGYKFVIIEKHIEHLGQSPLTVIPNHRLASSLPCSCNDLSKATTNPNCVERATDWSLPSKLTNEQATYLAQKCELIKTLNPELDEVTSREHEIPLAFSIVAHTGLEQLLRLVAQVYKPQNHLCLSIDAKADPIIRKIIQQISSCHSNVYLSDSEIDIHWGHYSVLQATMDCLTLLKDKNWHHVQIISGNDVPLKNNRDMVEVIGSLGSSNDAQLSSIPNQRWIHPNYFIPGSDDKDIPVEWRQLHREKNSFGHWISNLTQIRTPPHKLRIYKGSYANTLSHQFVQYLFSSPKASDLFEWVNETFVPDELYFSTLIHSDPDAPGHYNGACLNHYERTFSSKPWISRYDLWSKSKCHGKIIRKLCLFGVGDLPQLDGAKHLMAHKLSLDFEPATVACLYQRLHNKQLYNTFNTTLYSQLPAVRYSLMTQKQKLDYDCS